VLEDLAGFCVVLRHSDIKLDFR